jgi:iron(III) transport system ATP-binding protein
LRAVAGFEPLRAGRILIAGHPASTPSDTLPPEKRAIGMVFQDYALFPHLTIAQNIGFGLRKRPPSTAACRSTTCWMPPGCRDW